MEGGDGRAMPAASVRRSGEDSPREAVRSSRQEVAQSAKGWSRGQGRSSGESWHVQVSKALSKVLRHEAVALGLDILPDGYVSLEQVLACSRIRQLNPTTEEVQEVVETSDKQRFSIVVRDGSTLIRANQGHSMKEVMEERLLDRLQSDSVLPDIVVHGTYLRHWLSICKSGLRAGGAHGQSCRRHVHFATGLPRAGHVISGMRESCEVAVYLNVALALAKDL